MKNNEALKELAKREMAKRDLKTFLLMKWERFNQKPFLDSWHYDYLCKALENTLPHAENQIKRLILNMPPSYGKTEVIARTFPAWALGRDRSRKFIYISYNDTLCKKIINEVRALLNSKFWLSIFKEPPRYLRENSQEIILEEGGGLFVTTVKGAITGFHAHQVLIDDPIKVSDMASKVERDKVNDILRNIVTRLQDSKSNVTVLMQRLGDEDLCGFLLNPKEFESDIIKEWRHLKLRAINKEREVYRIGDYTYERAANEPLFMKKHDVNALESLRLQLGEDEFYTQYQQEPQASETGFFDKSYFKEIPQYEIGQTRDYIFVDNAMSLSEKADNRAMVCIGLQNYENAVRYVVKDCKFGIWDERQTIENLISMMLRYKTAEIYIESDGGGLTLHRLLQREIIFVNEKLKRQDKDIISNIIHVYTQSRKISKVEKIRALKPYYNTGFLVFLNTCENKEQIRKELLAFNPEKPFRKDDCIDCIASCVANKDCSPPSILESKSRKVSERIGGRAWLI